MKIGVMLREIGNQTDAPGIIVLNLLDNMLELDRTNEYILFYKNRSFIDRYASYPNVRTIVVPALTKLMWDQLVIPLAVARERIDLLFHPKHSLPLLVKCKTMMHLRGPEYWVFPDHFEKFDLFYQKLMLPFFCRKADRIIVESNYAKKDFQEFLQIPETKMTMIYLAPSNRFQVITDINLLSSIRMKYNLPTDFFLTVTRVVQGKKYYPGKNLTNAIKAFQRCKARSKLKFVVVGRQTRKFIEQLSSIPGEVRKDIIVLDFVQQEDLPAIYNLSKFFLFPSKYESFGVPLTEAMACGCPVITSTDFSCPEVVGNAGILVGPRNISQIADAIDRLSGDAALRENLRAKGFEEAKRFNWQKAAEETLKEIEGLK